MNSGAVGGLTPRAQALVPIEINSVGQLEVVDHGAVVPRRLPSIREHFGVGKRHRVWGWRTVAERAVPPRPTLGLLSFHLVATPDQRKGTGFDAASRDAWADADQAAMFASFCARWPVPRTCR